jgi:hypothetical protein
MKSLFVYLTSLVITLAGVTYYKGSKTEQVKASAQTAAVICTYKSDLGPEVLEEGELPHCKCGIGKFVEKTDGKVACSYCEQPYTGK